MSADNMIAILDDSSGVHRVQHMVSFYPEYMTREELAQAFEDAAAFDDGDEADAHARSLYRAQDICEYGVVGFTLDDAGYRSYEDLPAIDRAQREIMDGDGSMTQLQLHKRTAQILRDDLLGDRADQAVRALGQVDDRIVGELVSAPKLNEWQWDDQQRQLLLDSHVVRACRHTMGVHLTAVGAVALARMERLDADQASSYLRALSSPDRLELALLADQSDDYAPYTQLALPDAGLDELVRREHGAARLTPLGRLAGAQAVLAI